MTVALLTGRGNSTLGGKNLLNVCGRPLLWYPGMAAREAKCVRACYCSSDDAKILAAAEEIGFTPILRPPELAAPTAQHVDCIVHALGEIRGKGVDPKIIVVLLANNVTVRPDWIDDCVAEMKADPALTAVVPVYQDNDHHPLRAKVLREDGLLAPYERTLRADVSTNRQDLPPCYFLAHNFWVIRVSALFDRALGQPPWSFMGNRVKPYLIEQSIDIHAPIDVAAAEAWVRGQEWAKREDG